MIDTSTLEAARSHSGGAARGKRAFDWLFPLLLAGFLLMDKGFAWLHVPGTPLFVSEIVLAFGLAGAVGAVTSPLVWRRSNTVFLIVLLATWGTIRTIPGLLPDPVVALQDAAVWIYAIVVFAVLGAFLRRHESFAEWLGGYRRMILPVILWLPIAVLITETDTFLPVTIPDSSVSLFSFKAGNAAVYVFIAIAFMWLVWRPTTTRMKRRRAVMSAVGLMGVLAIATQSRGGFVAVVIGGAVLIPLAGSQRSRVVGSLASLLLIIAISVIAFDPELPLRGRDVSTDQFVNSVSSIVTGGGHDQLAGNIQWRLTHWGRIWRGVNENLPLTGHGFGVSIAEIYDIPQASIGLRNAHNSHLTIFSRLGWPGAAGWLLLWGFWFWETFRARRRLMSAGFTRLAGVAGWAMAAATAIHVNAIFDPTLEGPQVAFWLWTFCAVGIYLLIISRRSAFLEESVRNTAARLDEYLDGRQRARSP